MKTIINILIAAFAVLFITPVSGQSKAIYTHPDFNQLAADHQVLGILPFDCEIQLRPKELEKIGEEQLIEMEKEEGLAVQAALQSYFLRKKSTKGYRVDFQDVDKTNTLLKQANIDIHNLDEYTHQELADILEVDGVISGTLYTKKPMSEGASAALGVLVGVWGPTNSGRITIKIIDRKTEENLWQYDKQLSRSLGSDTNTIIAAMMRKASRKFPYIQ